MGPRASRDIKEKRKNLLPLQELQPQIIQFEPRHNTNYAGLHMEQLAHVYTLFQRKPITLYHVQQCISSHNWTTFWNLMLMGDACAILSVLSKINDVPQKVRWNGMDIMK